MRAGCSIRLSTPPRLSASVHTEVCATSSTASSSRLHQERDHAAEVAHLTGGDLVARVVGQPGPEHLRRRAGGSRGTRRRARAFAHCRSMRTASVFTPRSTSQASNGPGTAPSDFCRNRSRSAIVGSFVPAKPPMTSECPPRYFVVEWTTMSAPRSSGFWRYGVANVLSTTSRAPAARVAAATAAMSTRLSSGLVGVSIQTSRASPRSAAGSVRELGGRRVGEAVALRLVDLREHAVRAAVDVVHADDVVAGVEQVHDRRRRAEARRERVTVRGVLERGEALLERRSRRVRDARVVVALVHADRLLRERGGLVDRRRHRARRRVGLLAGMDRARLEVHRAHRSPGQRTTRSSPITRRRRSSARSKASSRARESRTPGSRWNARTTSSPLAALRLQVGTADDPVAPEEG